jgi:hypothetical protein
LKNNLFAKIRKRTRKELDRTIKGSSLQKQLLPLQKKRGWGRKVLDPPKQRLALKNNSLFSKKTRKRKVLGPIKEVQDW